MRNPLNTLFLSAVILLPILMFGQVQVFKTSEDFVNNESYLDFKEVRSTDHKKHVVFRDTAGQKVNVQKDSIWGYKFQSKKVEKKIRVFDGKTYVIDTVHSDIVLYKFIITSTIMIGDVPFNDEQTVLYFSKSLDDKPVELTAKNLNSTLSLTEVQKQKIEELRKNRKLKKRNKQSGQYHLIEQVWKEQL